MCEKKNENEDEAENEGPRTNRRGEVLMSSVKMGRRGGEQSKQVKGAEVVWHCLIPLLQTTPPPLQFPRLFRNGPASATRVSTIHVTAEATMAATDTVALGITHCLTWHMDALAKNRHFVVYEIRPSHPRYSNFVNTPQIGFFKCDQIIDVSPTMVANGHVVITHI